MRTFSTHSLLWLGALAGTQAAAVTALYGVTMVTPSVESVKFTEPLLPLSPLKPREVEIVQIPPSEDIAPLDKPAKPVILHRHSEKVRNAIKAIVPIARGARVVAVEYPPVQSHSPVSQVVPGSANLDESETPRPTTTFCRKVGNPKLPATRKEICFERDDVLRKVVRTYEKE